MPWNLPSTASVSLRLPSGGSPRPTTSLAARLLQRAEAAVLGLLPLHSRCPAHASSLEDGRRGLDPAAVRPCGNTLQRDHRHPPRQPAPRDARIRARPPPEPSFREHGRPASAFADPRDNTTFPSHRCSPPPRSPRASALQPIVERPLRVLGAVEPGGAQAGERRAPRRTPAW